MMTMITTARAAALGAVALAILALMMRAAPATADVPSNPTMIRASIPVGVSATTTPELLKTRDLLP